MNIEKAIKILDKFLTEHKLFNIKHSDGLEEAIETLIKKQSKEIDLHYVPYEQYVSTTNGIDKKWKDKIKAKIEEVKDGTYDAKIVLQSLLDKE